MADPATAHSRLREAILPVTIGVLAIAAFAPALNDGFVFDDLAQVGRRPPPAGFADWLRSGAEPWWPADRGKNLWRPVTRWVLDAESWVAHRVGGQPSPVPFHAFSLWLHAVASVLVFRFARELGLGSFGAVAAAAWLAVHPICSESVHQIVGQAELLAAIFMLCGLIAYSACRRNRAHWALTAISQGAFFALAVGSKEHAILYPAFVLLLEWSERRRAAAGEPGVAAVRDRIAPPAVAIVLGALTCLYLLGRWRVTGGLIEDPSSIPWFENVVAGRNFFERLPAAAGAGAYALGKAIVPIGLSPDYSATSLPLDAGWSWPLSWIGAGLAAGFGVWIVVGMRRGGRAWALAASVLAAFALTSNLFFTVGVGVAERLWYWPLVGLSLGVGAGAEALLKRWHGRGERPAYLALTLAIVLLLSAAWHYAPAWRSDLARSRWTVGRFAESWRGQSNLARELFEAGEFAEGLEHARRATEIDPEAAVSWDHLGLNAMALGGRDSEAEAALLEALRLDPKLHLAHRHLGNLLYQEGRRSEALVHYRRFVELETRDRRAVEQRIQEIESQLSQESNGG